MRVTMPRKLFAHINNPDSLEGTSLDGLSQELPIEFLLQFITEKSDYLVNTLQDSNLRDELRVFQQKLCSMLDSARELLHIRNTIAHEVKRAVVQKMDVAEAIIEPLKTAVTPLE